MWKTISLFAAVLLAGPALAACDQGTFEGTPYTACTVDPATETLRLWHTAPDGKIFGTFERIEATLAQDGTKIGFAMNGGMYHDDRRPVGLYVENGVETAPLVTRDGPGNFGLLPNGVFCLRADGAQVTETLTFDREQPQCTFASQSGPMLVIEGTLHPRFLENSTSRFIRNGVGVRADGTVIFAISDRPVTFHQFARLFRDDLGTPNALYIDGSVSRLYAPDISRHDIGFPLGPIVGTVRKAD